MQGRGHYLIIFLCGYSVPLTAFIKYSFIFNLSIVCVFLIIMSLAWGGSLVAKATRSGAGAVQPQMAVWSNSTCIPGSYTSCDCQKKTSCNFTFVLAMFLECLGNLYSAS